MRDLPYWASPTTWCATALVYLPYVTPISPLYLPYISPISPYISRHLVRRRVQMPADLVLPGQG